MFTRKQIEDIIDILYDLDYNTKLYIGTDSVRYKKNDRMMARYATVLVIHMNGCNGCKLFTHTSVEPDYDLKKNRPQMRMMNEVMKSCELYTELAPFIDDFDVEIHCDISLDEKNGSNCAAKAAAGYVLGVTGLEAVFKPNALMASFAADHAAHGEFN